MKTSHKASTSRGKEIKKKRSVPQHPKIYLQLLLQLRSSKLFCGSVETSNDLQKAQIVSEPPSKTHWEADLGSSTIFFFLRSRRDGKKDAERKHHKHESGSTGQTAFESAAKTGICNPRGHPQDNAKMQSHAFH